MHKGTWLQGVNFSKTNFTRHMNFIVVLYSVSNNGLPDNNSFCFQANAVKVKCMSESIYNVFAPIF
jgi:hypothetical protein